MASDLQTLLRKRATLKASITRHNNFIQKLNLDSITSQIIIQLQERTSKVESSLDEFDNIQLQIELLDTDSDISLHEDERELFENAYYDLLANFKELISRNQNIIQSKCHLDVMSQSNVIDVQENLDVNKTNVTEMHNVKLPQLRLPTFSGQVDQWLNFYDMFTSLIHNNQNLSLIQKFQYLKTSLTAEAAVIIQSLELTADNYNTAWTLLKQRFENKSRIIDNHVKQLFEMEVITKEAHIQLQSLLNNSLKHIRALNSLNEPTEHWDTLLIYLIRSKLDPITKREWEKLKSESKDVNMDDFINFLTRKCQLLESLQINNKGHTPITHKHLNSTYTITNTLVCKICKENHPIYSCKRFIEMKPDERINEVSKLKLCKNCFRSNHYTKDCNSSRCKKCHKRHNTLLHLEAAPNYNNSDKNIQSDYSSSNDTNQQVTLNSSNNYQRPLILLPTASVYVCDNKGNKIKARILLDSGSQSNFVTSDFAEKLNLTSLKINLPISGINNSNSVATSLVNLTLQSRFNCYKCTVSCLVLPQITNKLPQTHININEINIPSDIQLADSCFSRPEDIDILLGAEIFWSLLCIGQISLGKHLPTLQKTQFGWIISGPIHQRFLYPSCFLSINEFKELSIRQQMAAFWHVDELSTTNIHTREENDCEQFFQQTTTRNEHGRFVVRLPFNERIEELGQSYDIAKSRFLNLEKKFYNDPRLYHQYKEFIDEYKTLQHLSSVSYSDIQKQKAYFLPHHAVLKPEHLTTKIRVVFDGSCKTTSGLSLNNTLKVGPVVQSDLFSILIQFRLHRYAFTSDCEKMYRQVLVASPDRIYQNILWRENPSQDILIYQLNTVSYGTSSAPYLATRCLQQIAFDNSTTYPLACKLINNNFYVDDLIASLPDLDGASKVISELHHLLGSYGFKMRKWNSNCSELLKNVDKTNSITRFNDYTDSVKTLGLQWNREKDCFEFSSILKNTSSITKRIILASISTIFDPLGLISPLVVKSKIILQRLWQLNLAWDESLPSDLHTMWINYKSELKDINKITIPRQVLCEQPTDIELHSFSDASELSYGACVYLKTINRFNHNTINLLCAKGRVAPLKVITIPKLELMAAHLSVKLVSHITSNLNIKINRTYFWTDSTIVLAWLRKHPRQLKTFVAHRIADILSLTDVANWKHVISKDNPADILSRGANATQLSNSDLWWKGPSWLTEGILPSNAITFKPPKELPEVKTIILSTTLKSDNNILYNLINKHSQFIKLQHIIAYILRFIHNCKNKNFKMTKALTVSEIQKSLEILIKYVQSQAFSNDLNHLGSKGTISDKSCLKCLNPTIDEHGILRVGGRLKHSQLTYNHKFPYILPKTHPLIDLIIRYYHLKHLHAGTQIVLSAIRQTFWILSAKNTIKRIIRNCVTCRRFNCKPIAPKMGDLPQQRVTPSRPFSICGTDFAGPFTIRDSFGRSKKTTKAYLCLFICFSTKAVHLEIVSSLSTNAFIDTLKRFLARRGHCFEIHSDNGTNYVGASNELKQWYNLHSSSNHNFEVSEFCSKYSIQWKFIPSRSPHFGGLWESIIKSIKKHLYKLSGNSILSFEELYTLFCQIEAILNSRPLIPLSTNIEDYQFLSPAHFLVGDSLVALPEPSMLDIKTNRLKRFEMVRQMQQRFWKLWSHDYLSTLQKRNKWYKHKGNSISQGSLVLLTDTSNHPLLWRRGRVIQLHPGPDGEVRVVSVKTSTGIVKRSVTKMIELLGEYENV